MTRQKKSKAVGKAVGKSATKSAEIAQSLLTNPLLGNQYDAEDHLYHATTCGEEILTSDVISGNYSKHGVQSCVWAAGSVADAINHLVNAKRHHADIKKLDYNIHIFQVKSGSSQRAFFRKKKYGYSTSKGYKGAGGHNIKLFINDNHKVGYEIINIMKYFDKKK